MSLHPLETWRMLITSALSYNGDMWDRVVGWTALDKREWGDEDKTPIIVTLSNGDSDAWMDVEFDCGYGRTEGSRFTLWTEGYVYFPVCYDGAEWVGSAPRNPKSIALRHQGGG